MSGPAPDDVQLDDNRRFLVAAIAWLRETLERHGAAASPSSASPALAELERVRASLRSPPILDGVTSAFQLTRFESSLLMLCAAAELDGALPGACAKASSDARRSYPTFGLALATLPEPHWNALAPGAPLRRHRLIEMDALGDSTVHARLRIDERILHHLTGTGDVDARLEPLLTPIDAATAPLPASQRAVAERLHALWTRAGAGDVPLVQLCGDEAAGKRDVAAAAAAASALRLYSARAADLPSLPQERELWARLWQREQRLAPSALLLELDDADGPDVKRIVTALAERVGGHVLVATRDPLRLVHRLAVKLEVARPLPVEQESLWRATLGAAGDALNGTITHLVSHFSMSLPAIRAASVDAVERLVAPGEAVEPDAGGEALAPLLWEACRVQARTRLDDLAQRVDAVAEWDELVLPPLQKRMLHDIAAHVRQRARVYEAWGFGRRAAGLGISALFAGVSGSGKTMAAEVLGRELRLDLFRVDLSQVVSKYIGETEKNLRRIFDAAEEGGAILLFDEADALFGKRSEVKDSHDRYANLEVSYLLQRMEAYRGLAILTTNMRTALDAAFLRRLRFIVDFPFPDAKQRAEIWSRVFPRGTPTAGLDPEKLARLHVAGGAIRNIALNAAFTAADEDQPVQMRHLLHAARIEYLKIERTLNEQEVGGWS